MKLHEFKANRRTAKYRISNFEGWFRFAQAFFIKKIVRQKAHDRQNTFPRHLFAGGGFDIHYSIFAYSEFLYRFDWLLIKPVGVLTPET